MGDVTENTSNSRPGPSPEDVFIVRPGISKEQAAKKLSLRSPLPPFRKARFEKVELACLPHYLFKVRVAWKRDEEIAEAAVDAALGHFAMWRPEDVVMERVETVNHAPPKGPEFEIPFTKPYESKRII